MPPAPDDVLDDMPGQAFRWTLGVQDAPDRVHRAAGRETATMVTGRVGSSGRPGRQGSGVTPAHPKQNVCNRSTPSTHPPLLLA